MTPTRDPLTPESVEHVAKLARLALDDAEKARTLHDLNNILGLVAELEKLDLSTLDVKLDTHLPTAFRDDAAERRFERDALLANAPEAEEQFFRVPRILEEG